MFTVHHELRISPYREVHSVLCISLVDFFRILPVRFCFQTAARRALYIAHAVVLQNWSSIYDAMSFHDWRNSIRRTWQRGHNEAKVERNRRRLFLICKTLGCLTCGMIYGVALHKAQGQLRTSQCIYGLMPEFSLINLLFSKSCYTWKNWTILWIRYGILKRQNVKIARTMLL